MGLNNNQHSDEQTPTQTSPQVIYTAVGWVVGTYEPSPEQINHGVLVTDDGQAIPAQLYWRLRQQLNKKHRASNTQYAGLFQVAHRWQVYPQTQPLRFQLVRMKPLRPEDTDSLELSSRRESDEFTVVGEIESCLDGTVTIWIRRNEQPRKGEENKLEYQPFILTLVGSVVPIAEVGQIWDLKVRRSGSDLVILQGQPYDPASDPDRHRRNIKATAFRKAVTPTNEAVAKKNSPSKHPGNESQPKPQGKTEPQQIEATPSSDSTDVPTESQTDAPTPTAANTDISLTSGKMEVVVKLNQFPDDVRTVDKGWREFIVDTGSVMVTVTVKPKAFGALEQAKLDYPNWVAAISGQMGERTTTGFRLESASIKVFERKAKDASQPVQTTSQEISSLSSSTEPQLLPLEKTQKKQTVALPLGDPLQNLGTKTDILVQHRPDYATNQPDKKDVRLCPEKTSPQKTPPAVANPMQQPKEHLQQQRPSKTPPHRGQKQQPDDNVPPVGKQLSRDPKSLSGSQTTAAAQNSQQSQKPRFSVTIDGRVFTGSDSVTLNRRMVCIDGKLVGQAKMVVVLGQPRTMQADGGVSQGQNQAVLTSR